MPDDIRDTVVEIVSDLAKIPKEEIGTNVDFANVGIDSFTLIEVTFKLENKYDIIFPQENLLSIRNLDDLIKLTKEVLANRG